jgi:hypothetical protein
MIQSQNCFSNWDKKMKKLVAVFLLLPLYLFCDTFVEPFSPHIEVDEEFNNTINFKNRTYEFYLLDKLKNAAPNVIAYVKREGSENMSKKVPNSDPVCKAYVNALNKYPIIKDFFASPMLPNFPEFSHPEWKQLDIYEYKDVYLMAAFSNYYTNFDTYIPNKQNWKKVGRWKITAQKSTKSICGNQYRCIMPKQT